MTTGEVITSERLGPLPDHPHIPAINTWLESVHRRHWRW
jgi:hypothetical protein